MPITGMPKFFEDLISWYSMESLALGPALGLRAALVEGPGTAAEIAHRADADLRTTDNWLATMVAAGYATHDKGIYRVDADQVAFLDGSFTGVDTLALLEFVPAMGARFPAVVDVLRSAGAPPPDLYGADFGDAVGRVSAPMYASSLVADWIAADAELVERLSRGCTVVDLGCGGGSAVRVMAESFPESTFVGIDRNPEVLARARLSVPGNAEFRTTLPDRYDVAVILDTVHHLDRPDLVLSQLREGLGTGGVLVVAEPAYEGDLDADTASRASVIGLAAALLYCDVEGRGESTNTHISPRDGGAALRQALQDAGFTTVTTHEGAGGYRLYFAR